LIPENPQQAPASFTGSLSGTTMTITAVPGVTCNSSGLSCTGANSSGPITGIPLVPWNPGDTVTGTSVLANTTVVSQATQVVNTGCPAGLGSCGTYTVTPGSQSAASTALTLTYVYDTQPIIIAGASQ